jgi:tetratricopeptide (TPR) repeat protein
MGASQTALKRYKAAIKTFTQIVAIRPKTDEGKQARDLALLAIGRLELERGKVERAIAAYQRINRKSPVYERALFETVMAFVSREQYDRALQTIDILLLIVRDERLSIEAHVARGKLTATMGDYDEAVGSYDRILGKFAPIRNELNSFAKKRSNIDRFFSWLLERASASGNLNSPLTERTVKYLESAPAMKSVVRVFGSIGADREELRVANKLAIDLARVLTSSNRVELFPQLKEGWTRALALQNQLLGLSSRILDYEYGIASVDLRGKVRDEMEEMVRWRHSLEERFRRLPTTFEEYENRQAQIDARYVNLQRKSFLVEQTVKLLKRQLLAIEDHVNKKQFADGGEKLNGKQEGQIRDEINKEKARLGGLFKDLIALRDDIKAESDQVGTGDAVGAGERNLKQKLLGSHKREGLYYDEKGDALENRKVAMFSAFGRQRDRIIKSFEKLQGVIRLIDERVKQKAADLRRLIAAEKKHLVEYNVEMEGYEKNGRRIARKVGRRLFKRAHRQMKKVVLDADVGLIDVAWQRKSNKTKDIDKVRIEQAEKFRVLEEESQRLLREAGGDEEEGQ